MKGLKKIFTIIISFVIIVTSSATISAMEVNKKSELDSYVINKPYEFPITPDDPEWTDFDKKEDMLKVCQIPEDILKNMTTEALLQTVLNYPFIADYYAFDCYEDAAKTFSEDFNGFRELYSRKDLTERLLNKYKTTSISSSEISVKTATKDISKSCESDFFNLQNLEFLIAYDQVENDHYTKAEAEKLDDLLKKKMSERDENKDLTENSEVYLNFMAQVQTKVFAVNKKTTYATVKTPKGSSVKVNKISPDLSQKEKNAINNYYDKRYPNATRKASATTNFNCHSYAWYSQNTRTNKYWMNDPSKYWSDGSYKKFTDLRPRVGFKVYYYNGNHSAIVKAIKVIDGAQTFWYQSKWGSAGVYYHFDNYCPYRSGNRFYCKSAT